MKIPHGENIDRDVLPQSLLECDAYIAVLGDSGTLCIDGNLNATQLRELGAWLLEHENDIWGAK